jgi:hypothetical protein
MRNTELSVNFSGLCDKTTLTESMGDETQVSSTKFDPGMLNILIFCTSTL